MKEKSWIHLKGRSLGQRARKEDTCALTSLGGRDKKTDVPSVGQGAFPRTEQSTRAATQEPSGVERSGEKRWCFFLACLPLCRRGRIFLLFQYWAVGAVFVRCLARPLRCLSLFSSFLVGAVLMTGNGILGVPATPVIGLRLTVYAEHSSGIGARFAWTIVLAFEDLFV